MTPNKHESNYSDGERPYHHGDLRQTLLDVSLKLLESEESGRLSLRSIAREAGVSRAAPYHHFRDREALLAAIAAEGFRKLRSAMVERRESVDEPPLRRMQAMGVAYVLFSVRHPRLYRLMFSGELSNRDSHPELKEESDATYLAMLDALKLSMISDETPGRDRGRRERPIHIDTDSGSDSESLALGAWALVHGLSMLLIDGRVGGENPTEIQAVNLARETTRIIGHGIAG